METSPQGSVGATEGQIERELEMVSSAIAMVAGGSARRVTVAGIRFGEEILPEAKRLAGAAGLEVHALWHIDDRGCDLAVEARD